MLYRLSFGVRDPQAAGRFHVALAAPAGPPQGDHCPAALVLDPGGDRIEAVRKAAI